MRNLPKILQRHSAHT